MAGYVGSMDLELLAYIIRQKIEDEFQIKHLSKNLMTTIQFSREKNKIEVVIPAQLYDLAKFRNEGVVIHNRNGSYASRLDVEGSYAGNHVGYVDRIIDQSIKEWLGYMSSKKIHGGIVNK